MDNIRGIKAKSSYIMMTSNGLGYFEDGKMVAHIDASGKTTATKVGE